MYSLVEERIHLPNYMLRNATGPDADFLWNVTKITMHDYVEAIWGWDEEWQLQRFTDNFIASHWRVIVVDGQDAGGLRTDLQASDRCLYLANIHLLPEFQRRGIGSAVVLRLIEEARALGLTLRLNVLKSNLEARRFYERLGMGVVEENNEKFFMSTKELLTSNTES
jgi:ribosomal protein S18 acetylase RimI-like enzyme